MDNPEMQDGAPAADTDEGPSALLPKSVLGDKDVAPGDTLTLRVVQIYDDEVEVAPAGGGEKKGMMSADKEIEMMDRGGMMGSTKKGMT